MYRENQNHIRFVGDYDVCINIPPSECCVRFAGGGRNNYGGHMGTNRMNMSPWESQNPGQFGNNMRQGGGQMKALLDLPRGGVMGNRNQRGGPMINRGGGGGGAGGGGNRLNNRRGGQGNFQNRNTTGPKPPPKQGAGGIRKQNAFDRAKKLLAKNANQNKKKEATPGEKKVESVFCCYLCKNLMCHANSFENHIKGRTHLMMREDMEEIYRLKADIIRLVAKAAEKLKSFKLKFDHLKKAAESLTKVSERKNQILYINNEEGADGDAAEGEDAEGDEGKEGEEAGNETKEGDDLNESQEDEEVALQVDPEDCILDFADGDEIPSEVDTRLPKYNWQCPVGAGLISKLKCYECLVCSKFFDTEVNAKIHFGTATHRRNFVKFFNEKSRDIKIAQKRDEDDNDEEMDTLDDEAEPEPEPEPVAAPAPEPKKPAKTAPRAAATRTPAPAAATPVKPDATPSPAKKPAPTRAAAGAKSTPQRARGRFNRY